MHTSYVCPQRRVNFAECEEGLGMKLQPLSDKSNEDNAEVDVYPIQEELLVVAKVITTRAMVEEGEDWRQGCIFRTCVVHCNTVYDAIIDSHKSQIQCCCCGEKGHTSYACPKRRVNLQEHDEGLEKELRPLYYDSDEDNEEIDVHPIQGESLKVPKEMTTRAVVEGEDWR
ncbi:Uncharacterized protein TCM_003148 [Theobroma cacao]|uniref:CCHC-type domain-containing protein n=1 Tax=Theobroma cacao TaxID=3641 RepID=A0A061DPQ1_THECC|nr:Uncharacterized protein TCM_003148 [Theobroma cacao]